MSALRNQLRGRDEAYLMALLKNGDSDDPLVRAAYAELSGRGALPEYAEGMFDVTSPGPGDTPDPLESAATPIVSDPAVEDLPIYGRKVVGPRTATGNDPVPGAPMHSQDEVDAYYRRGIDPKTGEVTASGADQGMLERGFRPVYTEDGRVAYQMSGSTEGMSQGMTGSAPVQRVEQDRLVRTGYWDRDKKAGPLGASTEVLVPTPKNKNYNAALNAQRQSRDHLRRMTKLATELNPNAKPEDIAGLVGAVPETQAERHRIQMEARARAQGMREGRMQDEALYARGSHNINAGNAQAIRQLAALQRRDRDLHDQMVAENMRPRNVQQRFNPRTGQMEMTSEVAFEPPARGSGTEVNVNTPLQQAALDAKERETNPMAAGEKDVRGGNYASAQAQQVLDELATQFDTGGWHTMSTADEVAFRNHLVTAYGLSPQDAARVAKKHADKRRWSWLQGGGATDGAAPPDATGPGGLRVPPGSTPYRTGA